MPSVSKIRSRAFVDAALFLVFLGVFRVIAFKYIQVLPVIQLPEYVFYAPRKHATILKVLIVTTRRVTVSSPLRKLMLGAGFCTGWCGAPVVLVIIVRLNLEPLHLFLCWLSFFALATLAVYVTILVYREPKRLARAKQQWVKKFGGVNPIESVLGDEAWVCDVLSASEIAELERGSLRVLARSVSRT